MGSEKGLHNTSAGCPSQRRQGLGLVPGVRTQILVSATAFTTPIPRAPRTSLKKKSRVSVTAHMLSTPRTLNTSPKKKTRVSATACSSLATCSSKASGKEQASVPVSGTTFNKPILHTPRTSPRKKDKVPVAGTACSLTTSLLPTPIPKEPSFSTTFDSLQNLCKVVDHVDCSSIVDNVHTGSSIKHKLLSEDPCTPDSPAIDTGVCKTDYHHMPHVHVEPTDSSPNTHREPQSTEVLCKVIDPRQIELDTFLSADGCDTGFEDAEVITSSSTVEKHSISPVSEVPCPASSDSHTFDSLCQHADSYLESPPSGHNKSNGALPDLRGDKGDCIPNKVEVKKVGDEVLIKDDTRMREKRSLGCNSLRELANSNLNGKRTQKQHSTQDISKLPKTKRTCDECRQTCKTFYDLVKHIKYKHGPSVYTCPVRGCNFTTKYPNNIRHHQTKHTQVRPHQCGECNMRFKRKNQLATHILTHSDERPFACEQCDFRTKRGWVLAQHVISKHSDERPFECEQCGFRMKTRSDMNKHRTTHTQGKDLLCPHCDRKFTHRTRLLVHQKNMHSNKPRLPCSEKNCNKKFKLKSALQKHVNVVHKGIRKFCCDICRRTFSTKSNLENHMVTHDTTDRPFRCPICPYSGKEDAHLRAHIGSMHDVQVPGFSCDMCNVNFRVAVGLRQHLTTYKHQQNVRLRLPPEDREVKPDIVKISLDETTCDSQIEDTGGREGVPCVVIKPEPDVEDCSKTVDV